MSDELANIVWPRDPNPEPGIVGRLGRLLHWGITAGAAWIAGEAAYRYFTSANGISGEQLMWAAGTFALGRGVRYLLSGD